MKEGGSRCSCRSLLSQNFLHVGAGDEAPDFADAADSGAVADARKDGRKVLLVQALKTRALATDLQQNLGAPIGKFLAGNPFP